MLDQALMLDRLTARRPAHALERDLYCDDGVYNLDLDHIFYRDWLFALPAPVLPKPGAFATLQIGAYPVVIVRSTDGMIRAFHNVCRHRGQRLCATTTGSTPNLVCPYHQWTYGLDGKLLYARDMGDGFDPAAHGLKKVHCVDLGGMVFVCLAQVPPPIADLAKHLTAFLAPSGLKDAKVAHSSTIVENGNWKLVLENNRECYHCSGSHPSLCRTFSDNPKFAAMSGPDEASAEILTHWKRCEAAGLPSRFTLADDTRWRLARVPLLNNAESYTMSTKAAVAKRMGTMPFNDAGTLLFYHYPNTWNHFLGDHAITFRVLPISATQTEVTTTWLVHKDAVEGVDYDLKTLTEVWLNTNDEDRQVVEENQKGILSPAYEPGPYSPIQEEGVIQFVDWYTGMMTERLTPQPALAAEQMPAPTRISATAAWRDDEWLECVMVIPETPGVATFAFRAPSGAWFDYEPGQFLTLDLPVPGGAVQRTYTISSSPSRPLSISLTVKAQQDSIGTRWMLDHLRPGMKIKAYGPAGIFSFHRHPAEKYLFISAGSGITPMMSMTTWAWDSGDMPDIVFVHAARRPSDIIFRERLDQFANRVPGLQLRYTVKEPDPFRVWHGYHGRLNQIMLGLMAPDYLEREVFCCGPEPFMQAVRDMLNALGYDMDRYHQENFQAPVEKPADAPQINDITPDAATGAQISFTTSGVVAACTETDTVLAVARANGLNIPSGCTFGLCGTCKIRKTAGEVHMVHNGGISDEDIADGYILACCSNPLGRIAVTV